jgi:hypothetical protein
MDSSERPVQIAKVMVSKRPHREPELRFGRSAEDLRRLELAARIGAAEVSASSPHAVVRTANGESDGDRMTFDADRFEFVEGRLPRVAGKRSE